MPDPVDRIINSMIFRPGDILEGLLIGIADNNRGISIAIPGAGFEAIVPGTKSLQLAAIRFAKTFSGYISPLAVGMSHFFELGGHDEAQFHS
jgi:hypothetical protein